MIFEKVWIGGMKLYQMKKRLRSFINLSCLRKVKPILSNLKLVIINLKRMKRKEELTRTSLNPKFNAILVTKWDIISLNALKPRNLKSRIYLRILLIEQMKY